MKYEVADETGFARKCPSCGKYVFISESVRQRDGSFPCSRCGASVPAGGIDLPRHLSFLVDREWLAGWMRTPVFTDPADDRRVKREILRSACSFWTLFGGAPQHVIDALDRLGGGPEAAPEG